MVRPIFRLVNGVLLQQPARDFARFLEVQRRVVEAELGGGRIVRRPRRLFLPSLLQGSWQSLRSFPRAEAASSRRRSRRNVLDETTIRTNLAVLESLRRDVREHSAELLVADLGPFFDSTATHLSGLLREFCRESGAVYAPVSDDLSAAAARGVAPRWEYDCHFNEEGNRIIADALHRALGFRYSSR